MASRAEKERRKRGARISAAALAAPPGPRPVESAGDRRQFVAREDGLTMLRAKGRITAAQALAGRTYGVLVRTAALTDGAPIRSFLDIRPSGGGAGGGRLPPGDLGGPEWVAECRWRLARAQGALGWHSAMIASLGLICAQGLHPREITTVQRETEQIETALRLGLDILRTHWEEEGFRGVGDWP
jgi:hypothetical protein